MAGIYAILLEKMVEIASKIGKRYGDVVERIVLSAMKDTGKLVTSLTV